jgi:hypothetical protein
MATDRLRYDKMVEDALRGVVRKALREAASKGLPGDHHFYITFDTTHRGAVLPDWLREQYPEQMTIVLQHQYWGLEVEDELFSVTLSFNNRQERLTVPFAAIARFTDPAVKFGLQFETDGSEEEASKPVGKLPAPVAAASPKPAAAPPPNGADVVTLDAFRKK